MSMVEAGQLFVSTAFNILIFPKEMLEKNVRCRHQKVMLVVTKTYFLVPDKFF